MGKRFYKIRNINLRRRPGYSWKWGNWKWLKVKCKILQKCNSCRIGIGLDTMLSSSVDSRSLAMLVEDVRPALMHSDTCLDIEIILGSAWRSGISSTWCRYCSVIASISAEVVLGLSRLVTEMHVASWSEIRYWSYCPTVDHSIPGKVPGYKYNWPTERLIHRWWTNRKFPPVLTPLINHVTTLYKEISL